MAPFYLLPLMAVGYSVLVLLIDGAAGQCPTRSAFAAGWFFGFGYFLLGVYWMAYAFFVQAEEFAWMSPFAVLGMPAFLGLFSGAAALVAHRFWRPGWRRVVLFAGVWCVFEYLRGHVLTGLPWNLPGQALAGAPAGAQTAAWYGVYGLSLVATAVAAAPAAWLGAGLPPRRTTLGLGLALAGTAALYLVGAARLALPAPPADGETFVRIVQPNIPQREKIDWSLRGRNFFRQLNLSEGAAPAGAKRLFVVWPENAVPLLDEDPGAIEVLDDKLAKNAVLLSGSVRRSTDASGKERYYNSVVAIAPTPEGRRVVDIYDKHHLVPFGEYLPLYDLFNAVGLAQLTPYGDAGFTPGAGPAVMEAGGPAFSPLVCYEAIFPGAMYPHGDRPQWLLMVTNDAWFGDSSGPRQHLDQARLRSIETGLPMARSANTGISALIDAKGRILARVKLYTQGRIDAALPPALGPTLYDRVGDWLFFAMLLGCFAAAFSRRRP